MNNSLGVGCAESLNNLYPPACNLVVQQRLAANALLQCLTFQQLHDYELASFVLVNVMNCADMRMI
jgi:hypothetical protein